MNRVVQSNPPELQPPLTSQTDVKKEGIQTDFKYKSAQIEARKILPTSKSAATFKSPFTDVFERLDKPKEA